MASPEGLMQVTYQQYADVNAFRAVALPILERDVLRNTLCLTQLNTIDATPDNAPTPTLAVLSCSSCAQHTVLIAAKNKGLGYSTCFASAGACVHNATQLGVALKQQLQLCESVTMTAAAAELMQPDDSEWVVDHDLQLMVLKSDASTPTALAAPRADSAQTATAIATAATATDGGTPGATTATAAGRFNEPAGTTQSQPSHQQQPQQLQQQQLRLRQCSPDGDAALVLAWSTAFLKEVFDLTDAPPTQQQAKPEDPPAQPTLSEETPPTQQVRLVRPMLTHCLDTQVKRILQNACVQFLVRLDCPVEEIAKPTNKVALQPA